MSDSSLEKCDSSTDDVVDPRIQVELERLNSSTDLINKLEIELNEARNKYRELLQESSVKIDQLSTKLGSCVAKAKPYYEARMAAKKLQKETQNATLRYERATSAHSIAKEMVSKAEEGLLSEGSTFDLAWQDVLNHATLRVNEAENERVMSHHEHQRTSLAYNAAERDVQNLHQKLKKSIVKSSLSTRRSLLQLNNLANQHQLQLLPYFEMKAKFNQSLEERRTKLNHLEENILKMKMNYSHALHTLEEISYEIHQKRKENNLCAAKHSLLEDGNQDKDQFNDEDSNGGSEEFMKLPDINPNHEILNCLAATQDNLYHTRDESSKEFMKLPDPRPQPRIMNVFASVQDKTILNDENSSGSEEFIKLPDYMKPNHEILNCLSASQEKNNLYYSRNDVSEEFMKLPDQRSHLEKINVLASIQKKSDSIRNCGCDTKDKVISPLILDDTISDLEKISPPKESGLVLKKLPHPDLNVARIQAEEFSDSESLASIETLDDEQIECLMLENKEI